MVRVGNRACSYEPNSLMFLTLLKYCFSPRLLVRVGDDLSLKVVGKGGALLDPMWAGYLSMQPAECVFWGLEVWNVKTTLNPSS